VLTFEARKHANALGSDVGKSYLYCGALTTVLWILYPIAWGVCEGGNVISPDSEAAFYGTLDFLAKIGFGCLLLWGHRGIDPGRLGLRIRDYDEDPAVHGAMGTGEKKDGAATNGHTNGATDGANAA